MIKRTIVVFNKKKRKKNNEKFDKNYCLHWDIKNVHGSVSHRCNY